MKLRHAIIFGVAILLCSCRKELNNPTSSKEKETFVSTTLDFLRGKLDAPDFARLDTNKIQLIADGREDRALKIDATRFSRERSLMKKFLLVYTDSGRLKGNWVTMPVIDESDPNLKFNGIISILFSI